VLEELEHAKARGAKIYAELVGYGATSDGARHGGAVRRRRHPLHAAMALSNGERPVDYINPHGTSTPVGDIPEINAHARSVRRQNSRPSAPPSRSPATARALPACMRRSIPPA
jgi:3-oxoacyl-[acyl-carrier-protein] synthase-1